jgi:hypothetical protein
VRHRDERTHDGGIFGIVGDRGNEAAIDLDAGNRKLGQIAERGVARAEIVECELDAPVMQLLQRHDGVVIVQCEGSTSSSSPPTFTPGAKNLVN